MVRFSVFHPQSSVFCPLPSALLVQDGDYADRVEYCVDKDGAEKRAAFFVGVADAQRQHEKRRPVAGVCVSHCE